MLNLKKVIALVCVFALTLTTVAFGATYTDVTEDSAYYEAVETLNKLEIVTGYEDGTFKPEDGVTRAEMAALIARIQGYGETAAANANTAFTDVPASHWASGYIANAAGMGIINGYGDGTFGPEDPVLYEQAVKMVMATLGYTPFAEKNGGYPTGYLAAAQRYDVSLAVANAAVGQEANRGTVAQLLTNALDTPLMIQAKWSTDGTVDYAIADDPAGDYGYKTLMSENLGYVKIRGIVDANATTEIGAPKSIDTEEDATVEITIVDSYNTENPEYLRDTPDEFLVADTDAADYIGRSVIGYVKKINNDWTMISVAVDTARNDELVIGLDQLAAVDIAGGKISYYKDGANTATEVAVETTIAGIFNGDGSVGAAAALGYALSGKLYGGQIKFIDNDDTKGYDVAIVDLAATGVVKKVTEDGISFYNSVQFVGINGAAKAIEIDADDETSIVKIMKDGAEIAADELVEYDVLSIYAVDAESDYIVADVVANQVVGTIAGTKGSKTSAFPASNGLAYNVDGTYYDVAKGAYGVADLAIGEGGTFYVDEFGKIAAFVEDAALAGGTSAKYGYVLGTSEAKADFGAAGFEVKVQMVTADGVQVLDVKNNAKLTSLANAEITLDIEAWTETSAGSDTSTGTKYSTLNALVGEIVEYVTDSEGNLKKIVAAYAGNDFAPVNTLESATATYDKPNGKFSTGLVDADAMVFVIGNATNSYVGTLEDLDDENVYDITDAYVTKKGDDCNVLAITLASMKTSTTDSIAVIVDAGVSVNEYDETIWNITYMKDGVEVTADTTPEVVDDTVNKPTLGDIVKVKVGSSGLITSLAVIYDFGNPVRNFTTNAYLSQYGDGAGTGVTDDYVCNINETVDGGVVTAFNEDRAIATINNGTAYNLLRAKNIYVVDTTGRTDIVKLGSEANFKYFEKLYVSGTVTVTDANDNPFVITPAVMGPGTDTILGTEDDVVVTPAVTTANMANTAAQAYADHIYVRTYDGVVTDAVIVKGANIKVK